MTFPRLLVFLMAAVVGLAGCGPAADDAAGGTEVTGRVVAIDGDLAEMRGFDLLTPEGTRLEFVTATGLVFGDDEPISHLQDHFVSGSSVVVRYETGGDSLVAVFVGDDH